MATILELYFFEFFFCTPIIINETLHFTNHSNKSIIKIYTNLVHFYTSTVYHHDKAAMSPRLKLSFFIMSPHVAKSPCVGRPGETQLSKSKPSNSSWSTLCK